MYLLLHDTADNEMLIRTNTIRFVVCAEPGVTRIHTDTDEATVRESVRDIAKLLGAYGLINDEPEKV